MEDQLHRIDRLSKLPLYHQLYEILRGMIQRRELQPGDLLPPESELTDRYQVSRTTVRQVLDMLVNDGLIFRQAGRGTFVAQPTVEQGLVRIVSFTEDMRLRGIEPSSRVLFSDLVPASGELAGKLQIRPGEELARLVRMRLADGEAMSVEESFLVHSLCPGILKGDYISHSLREALARQYGIQLLRARQTIRALPASPELARSLSIKPRSPVLSIERVSYSQQDLPVEFLRIHYRGDRYSLHAELQG